MMFALFAQEDYYLTYIIVYTEVIEKRRININ